jgi:winged helix DNA-binding protein
MLRWPSVLAWRLRRQHLARRVPRERAHGVVADIGGLHAQLAASAELTLWARVGDLEPGWVRRAVEHDRTLVKTWAMRGTLHLLPAAELAMWSGAQAALPPRWQKPAWRRGFGVTEEDVRGILAAIPRALDGEPLTREQLAAAVARELGSDHLSAKLGEGFGALLKPSAFLGDLCFAAPAGSNVRFTRPDRWLDDYAPVAGDAAADAVTRRYLAAYGPATREQYARWLGTPSAAHAGRLIRRLGDDVVADALGGDEVWLLAADLDELRAAEPEGVVRLLPAFDQYVVAAPRDGGAVLDPQERARVYRPQGWLSPVLLVDGRIEGVWRHERRGSAVRVEIEPFANPSGRIRAAAEAEARRLAAFLGGDLELAWAER